MNRRNWIKTSGAAGTGLLISKTPTLENFLSSPKNISIKPRWNEKGTPLRHTWAGLGNVDQMRWILRRDMQEQLALCHKEIGLKHVRAVGIFDNEMWVFDKDPANYLNREKRNTKRYNWRVPYYIYDSLVDIGIAPVVTTCFTPGEMKTGPQTCFATGSNITPPRDWKEWERFVNDFVKGLADRYGIETLKNWYFEVWNEPNLGGFWTGGMDGFFKMFQIVHGAIKSVDSSLKVGGPSTAHSVWLRDLIDFGAKNNCMPDYIIGHIYNNDSTAGDPLSPFDGPQGDKENKSPHFLSGITRGARKQLNEAGFKGEFHMNEWGLSWHPFAPVRETANEAAFIVKSMCEVSQLADYFAYWCISDIYNQVGYGREAFHGNYGMLNLDGLRKPNYFAHQLLCKLGSEKIEVEGVGDLNTNAFVTRNGKEISAIVYAFDINYTEESAVGNSKVEFTLPAGTDKNSISLIRLDSKENNIVNTWKQMGSPAYPKQAEIKSLAENNELSSSSNFKINSVPEGLLVTFDMETPGIVFIQAKTL